MLGQCRELVHLNLSRHEMGSAGDYDWIGDAAAESLAGVLAQCTALAHLDLSCKGQRGLQESWHSAQRWLTSISAGIRSLQQGQSVLQECWGSAQRWLTSISTTIGLAMLVQRVLQECWGSAYRWLTSISATMALDQTGQRVLLECWGSAQRWLTSISTTIRSAMSGKAGLELRGVVKPLALFCRDLALLALCHLLSRQATRKSDILCTYSAVTFGLALGL